MKNFTSLALAIALATTSLASRPAKANPAILAPAALCSTGVGCILVGTVLIAGATYYVWRYGGGKKAIADAKGLVFKSDYLEDPEEEIERMGNNATQGRIIKARNATEAFNICRKFKEGRKVSTPLDLKNGKFQCRYH